MQPSVCPLAFVKWLLIKRVGAVGCALKQDGKEVPRMHSSQVLSLTFKYVICMHWLSPLTFVQAAALRVLAGLVAELNHNSYRVAAGLVAELNQHSYRVVQKHRLLFEKVLGPPCTARGSGRTMLRGGDIAQQLRRWVARPPALRLL